jgi:hypothetical protein
MSDKPVAWAVQLSSGNLITASTDKNAELEWAGNYDGATVIPLYTQPQPAVPDHLMARIKNLLLALGHQGAVLDEGEPPYDVGEWGIKEAQELYTLLSTPTTPQADGWVRCEERLPTEADDDFNGCVWARFEDGDIELMEAEEVEQTWDDDISITHWMPTGLKRPQPPKEGA